MATLPTSAEYIRQHAVALQALHLVQIVEASLAGSPADPGKQEVEGKLQEKPLEYRCHEAGILNQIKMEVAQRLVVRTCSGTEVEELLVKTVLDKIWAKDETKTVLPVLADVSLGQQWERCVNATVELLFAKFGHTLAQAGQAHIQKDAESPALATGDYIAQFLDKKGTGIGPFGFECFAPLLAFHNGTPASKLEAHDDHAVCTGPPGTQTFARGSAVNYVYEAGNEATGAGSRVSATKDDTIPEPLCYAAYFALALQYVVGVSKSEIYAALDPSAYTKRRCCESPEFARWIVRFFTEVPYIPALGFRVLWAFASATSTERKISLAVLASLLKSTAKPSLNKRTAYRMLLCLTCAALDETRQDALALANRKIVYTPSALGHFGDGTAVSQAKIPYSMHNNNALATGFPLSVREPSAENYVWDNVAAVGPWLEQVATTLVRRMIELCPGARQITQAGERLGFAYRFAPSPLADRLAQDIAATMDEEAVRRCEDDVEGARKLVQHYGTLLSVLCSHRPGLLAGYMDCYAVATSVSSPLAQALCVQFYETLQWIPVPHLSSLFLLLEDANATILPLYLHILTTLATTALAEPALKEVPSVTTVANEGLRLYERLACLAVVVPILPCLQQAQAELFVKRIVATGNKELVTDTFRSLLAYSGRKGGPGAFVKQHGLSWFQGDHLLALLFQYTEPTPEAAPDGVPFRCVVDALDICVALAQGAAPVFPPQVFLTFLGQLVDSFLHCDGAGASPGQPPKLFGRLLLITVIRLPSLCPAIVSELLPLLLREHSTGGNRHGVTVANGVWNDPITWRGICAAFTRLWTDYSKPSGIPLSSTGDKGTKSNSQTVTGIQLQLQRLLCGLPQVPFESLFQELQRTHPSTRTELIDYLFLGRETAPVDLRATVAPHVLSILGV